MNAVPKVVILLICHARETSWLLNSKVLESASCLDFDTVHVDSVFPRFGKIPILVGAVLCYGRC